MIPLFFLHYRISTHTLTWSVTKQAMSGVMLYYISTHTLTWSVTLQPWWLPPMCQNFNSHAHVERDICAVNSAYDDVISTHTLTWSVTATSPGCNGS